MPKHNNLDIYPFDPNIDQRDGLFGFDYNTGGKSKNFKLEHLRYFILQGLDASNNGFLINNGFTLVDNVLTINAGWQWLLNGLLCSNEDDFVFTLEYTAEGFVRIDSVYVNSNGEFLVISGTETETIAIPPLIPVNTLLAFSINIFDTTIESGEEPVLGNVYLKKIFDKLQYFSASGTNVVIPFSLYGYNTIVLDGSMTSVSGFSFTDLVANPTIAEYPHEGKMLLLINRSNHNITLKHADFASSAVSFFNFDSGADIIIPQNGKLFIKYTSDGLANVLKSWTAIDDVTGLSSSLSSKENTSNKVTTIAGNENSNVLFASVKAFVDWTISLFVPKTRTLTIGGVTQDLSANRTFPGGASDEHFIICFSISKGASYYGANVWQTPDRETSSIFNDSTAFGSYYNGTIITDARVGKIKLPFNCQLVDGSFYFNHSGASYGTENLRILAFDIPAGLVVGTATAANASYTQATTSSNGDLGSFSLATLSKGTFITYAIQSTIANTFIKQGTITLVFKKI